MSAALWYSAIVSCFVHSVCSQGPAVLTLSSSAVYSGETITLTCDYGSAGTLQSVLVEAFNATQLVGSCGCSVMPVSSTATGVFSGSIFAGCPAVNAGVSNVNVSLTAASSFELEYNCSATVGIRRVPSTITSNFASLSVLALPETPKIQKRLIAYKENENATVVCESRNGKPAAAIRLTVTNSRGAEATAIGDDYASLLLPPPLTDWQNATAVCNVTNHKAPNMTVYTDVEIIYIMRLCNPAAVDTSAGNATLDCTTCIRSYPSASYSWSVQADADLTDSSTINGSSTFSVLQGQSGRFFCIATNPITMKTIVLAFTASVTKDAGCPGCEQCWYTLSAVSGIFVITAIILGVLWKRRQTLTGSCSTKLPDKQISEAVATEQNSGTNPPEQYGQGHYETTNARSISQRAYEELIQKQISVNSADYENCGRR